MPKKIRYEVSGYGSDAYVTTLAGARKLAKRRAKLSGRSRFVLIYKLTTPGCRNCKTILVEKWKVNAYGYLTQQKV